MLPGKRIIVWRLKSRSIFCLIANFAPSVPKRKPSGTMTAARPLVFSLYIISTMKRSAVSLERNSIGKLLLEAASVLPPYGGFIAITLTLSSSLKSDIFVPSESQWRIFGDSTSCKRRLVIDRR